MYIKTQSTLPVCFTYFTIRLKLLYATFSSDIITVYTSDV